IKEKYPQYKVGYLTDADPCRIDFCIENHFDAIHPYFPAITPEFVKKCHDNNILVNVWTVDEEEDIKRMKDYDVDVVISNDLATAQRILGK
ncbi:MAG: glycerophosphodiester phosphodiesterase, partial [Oscillospiraceae bacterium]